jgi:hypothetical protein
VSYWSGIEMLAGMICACLPAMKALGTICCGVRRGGDSHGNSYERHYSSNQQRPTGPSGRSQPIDPTLTFSENDDLQLRPRSDDDSVSELVAMGKSDSTP